MVQLSTDTRGRLAAAGNWGQAAEVPVLRTQCQMQSSEQEHSLQGTARDTWTLQAKDRTPARPIALEGDTVITEWKP